MRSLSEFAIDSSSCLSASLEHVSGNYTSPKGGILALSFLICDRPSSNAYPASFELISGIQTRWGNRALHQNLRSTHGVRIGILRPHLRYQARWGKSGALFQNLRSTHFRFVVLRAHLRYSSPVGGIRRSLLRISIDSALPPSVLSSTWHLLGIVGCVRIPYESCVAT